jgi:hypothetical protein
MKSLGYKAMDKYGTLYNFEWGTGQYEGNFYIIDVTGKRLSLPELYEIVEVGIFVAEPLPCDECGYVEDMIATHYEECSKLNVD